MSARTDRIAAALSGIRQRMDDKNTQISELTRAGEALRTELTAKVRELSDASAARDRLQAFIDTPDWGQLDSGASIAEGDVVRFGALTYRAKMAHTKALTRSPINLVYWQVITD